MLQVMTLDQANRLLQKTFENCFSGTETVALSAAAGRVLTSDVCAAEYVPDFDRSQVDGYALRASDTFGCSESIPALLEKVGEVLMGEAPQVQLRAGECAYVPTGGALPEGADAMVMIEHTEIFPDGTIAVLSPTAPGRSVIFRGDDVKPGDAVLPAGRRLSPSDVGALAAMGVSAVTVCRKLRVGVLSTGDELVECTQKPAMGEIRDVNRPMLLAMMAALGAECVDLGICRDDYDALRARVAAAAQECDMLLLSGGTSVGTKDASALVVAELGELLVHGLALKPGKPTLAGSIGGKPVFGLPGHPVAAYFVTKLCVEPLARAITGETGKLRTVRCKLSRTVPSNNGREEIVAVRLTENGAAEPVAAKSGLITTLSGAEGFIRIPRDREGFAAGAEVEVHLFES